MAIKVLCRRCAYSWEYKGGSNWYCSCPRCHLPINLKKLGTIQGVE
jgi:hypothetical protein